MYACILQKYEKSQSYTLKMVNFLLLRVSEI